MIVLVGWPCEAEDLRSRLSHNWLVNRVLRLDAGAIAKMHGEEPSESNGRKEFESYLLSGGLYEKYLCKLKILVNTVVDGYSPEQLVSKTVLNTLPNSTQKQIKLVLRDEYLSICISGTNTIENLREDLRDTASTFETTLTDFSKSWCSHNVSEEVIKDKFENVLRQASDLKEVLSQLPRGIIIP